MSAGCLWRSRHRLTSVAFGAALRASDERLAETLAPADKLVRGIPALPYNVFTIEFQFAHDA